MTNLPKGTSGRDALEVAKQAATEVGRFISDKFTSRKEVTFKSRNNPVTNIDVEAEKMARSILQKDFPDFQFLGEESSDGGTVGDGYTWIVDPIDGTRNYVAGIPFFSIVVGLVKDGQTIVGINHDPMRSEMFWAVKGGGAFLNNDPIHVSSRTSFTDCVLGFDLSYNSVGALNSMKIVESLWYDIQTARIMGSSALGLSYAAAGRVDAYFHHKLSPWDIVAGLLLVREAGGVVTDRHGKEAGLYTDGIVATNRALLDDFMQRTEGTDWRKG